ncbi:MAG: hypothetical protein RL033_1103 [Pseudomonadota bacterium]|jgi:hypothetical protein
MMMKFWMSALIVCVGCGEVTAEPISSTSLAITRVDIDVADSADPYACTMLSLDDPDAEGVELHPLVRVGELAYSGRCTSPEQPRQCWFTGDIACEQTGRECGGFSSSIDPTTGSYELAGGQHMLCPYSCERDDQCPASASGTARPSCMLPPGFNPATDSGTCMLGCGSGETCPDGFVCIQPGLSFSVPDGSLAPDGTPLPDGTLVPAPAQCVQFHQLTLHGDPTPR